MGRRTAEVKNNLFIADQEEEETAEEEDPLCRDSLLAARGCSFVATILFCFKNTEFFVFS